MRISRRDSELDVQRMSRLLEIFLLDFDLIERTLLLVVVRDRLLVIISLDDLRLFVDAVFDRVEMLELFVLREKVPVQHALLHGLSLIVLDSVEKRFQVHVVRHLRVLEAPHVLEIGDHFLRAVQALFRETHVLFHLLDASVFLRLIFRIHILPREFALEQK